MKNNTVPDSLFRIPGREKPPVPWDDKKGAGMSLGELLIEEVEDIIEVDDKPDESKK